jgi:hypothetical protein
MGDAFPPSAQRPALLDFVEALSCRDNALRRDGASMAGSAPSTPFPKASRCTFAAREFEEPPPGSQKWANAKKAMPFASVAHDGDSEGTPVIMDRLPAVDGAEVIRDKFGIPKKREVSAAEREGLRAIDLIGRRPPAS